MNKYPILTYTDESLNRRQTITLWEDRVHLKGKMFLKGEYEASFPLKAISPDYQDVVMRDNAFWHFLFMTIITLVIAGVFHAIPGTDAASSFGMLLTALPLGFAVGCLMTFGKIRMAYFLSTQGQPLFAVAKGGKEKNRFDEAVSRIVTQIKNAEQPAGSPGTTTAHP